MAPADKRIYLLRNGKRVVSIRRPGEDVWDSDLEDGSEMTCDEWREFSTLVVQRKFRIA